MGAGGACIAVVLIWVAIAGSWNRTPEVIQLWGSLIRLVSDLPLIGNLSFLLWGVFFLPGLFIFQLGRRLERNAVPTETTKKPRDPFKVYVDDNFHYMDKDERYFQGEYDTEEQAIGVCQKIVDDYLFNAHEPGMTTKDLYESYVSFGEDPFIQGGSFSGWGYAETRSEEITASTNLDQIKNVSDVGSLKNDSSDLLPSEIKSALSSGMDLWEREIDKKYDDILRSSEIIEDIDRIYFCSKVNKSLIAGWDISNSRWIPDVQREELDGLSFSTPNRFEELVFGGIEEIDKYVRKQCLIEYVLVGISNDEFKTLKKNIGQGKTVQFSVDSMIWNSLVIGNGIKCEIYCKILEDDRETELIELCVLSSEDAGWITLEMLSGSAGKELFSCGTKELDGYYT